MPPLRRRLVNDDQGMSAPAPLANPTASGEAGGIEATGLTKSYGSIRAVRGIDLQIMPGETVALLGPNGAGKTKTIDMILGLRYPDAGAVSVCGLSRVEVKRGVFSSLRVVTADDKTSAYRAGIASRWLRGLSARLCELRHTDLHFS
jgi:ABC-type Na+ transport system ATPase subunit NatA